MVELVRNIGALDQALVVYKVTRSSYSLYLLKIVHFSRKEFLGGCGIL